MPVHKRLLGIFLVLSMPVRAGDLRARPFTLDDKIRVCDLVAICREGSYPVVTTPGKDDETYVEMPIETVLYGPRDLKVVRVWVSPVNPVTNTPLEKISVARSLCVLQHQEVPAWNTPAFDQPRWNVGETEKATFKTLQNYDLTPVDAAHYPGLSRDALASRKQLVDGVIPHVRLLVQARLQKDIAAL